MMTQEEKIVNQLQNMGFELTEIEDTGYLFNFNEVSYLYTPDESDEHFMRISIPECHDVTEENRRAVLEVMNDTEVALKYAKLLIVNDGVWISYEYYLLSDDHLEQVLEHLIRTLFATWCIFQQKINGEEDSEEADADRADRDEEEAEKELEQLLNGEDSEEPQK